MKERAVGCIRQLYHCALPFGYRSLMSGVIRICGEVANSRDFFFTGA